MNNADDTASCPIAVQLEALSNEVAEIRDGQHELLRMYEEVREQKAACCCRCRRQPGLTLNPLAGPDNHEDYVPGGDGS